MPQHEGINELVEVEAMRRFIELKAEKETLKKELDEVEKQLGLLDTKLCEQFALAGIQKISLEGKTIYRQVDKYVSVKAEKQAEAVQIARGQGLDYLISLQPARLKSYVNEFIEQNGTLPSAFANLLNVFEKPSIRMRNS